jgi:hypothetical protein
VELRLLSGTHGRSYNRTLTMATHARRHHFLPRFYLAGFTLSSRVDDYLYVFDLGRATVRRARPHNEAVERDLYRVDMPGMDPDLFEKTWAGFEAEAARVIASIRGQDDMSEDALNMLLNFMAMTVVRAPAFRKSLIRSLEDSTGLPFREAVARPESWRWIVDEEALGLGVEEVASLLRRKDCKKAHPQIWHFFSSMVLHDSFLRLMAERAWHLYVANEGADFVTCDDPVGIARVPGEMPYRAPSFRERDTVISFPINRHAALAGSYDGRYYLPHDDRRIVAVVNTGSVMRASRCIYAPQDDFVCLKPNGEFGEIGDASSIRLAGNRRFSRR